MTDRGFGRWLTIGFVSTVLLSASPILAADSIRSEIEAANKVFEANFARGDSSAIAALYTKNAQLLPAQSDFVTGTEAIDQFWRAAFDSGMKGISLVAMEVEEHGETAYEVGELEIRARMGRCWIERSTSLSGRKKVAPGNSIAISGPRA